MIRRLKLPLFFTSNQDIYWVSTEILENYEPSDIPGVGRSDNLSDAQLARVDFYSELGDAFRAAAPTRVASISSQGGTQ